MINDICSTLLAGGIVVIRTDTIYGIIARMSDKDAVEKVYAVKHREADKQCITLIAQPSDVPKHGATIEAISKSEHIPTSVVVPATHEPAWILHGGKDVAYRLVKNDLLRQVIEKVGPVIAPSANQEGKPTASNIAEARRYFGDQVDLYVDGGTVPRTVHASQIIRINPDGSIEHLR
ncbi:MAG: L-threonylcarbamoyladenylate synthase [Acidobacteria bacterium]|nr:L-threonylcarbamoyladenylate synthase [Acidobacteriota bacterium]